MQYRILNLLVIGGVAVSCIAPRVIRAEDSPADWQPGLSGRVASNINIVANAARDTPAAESIPEQLNAPAPVADVPFSSRFRPLIDAISRKNSVDPDLIDAMIRTESNYNPWAISSKGARGLMQLIPETGRRFGVQDFFDPQQNIEGGVRYFKYLLDMFRGDIDLSLAAYNAGENLVARLGRIPPIPETRNYVRKIHAVYTKTLSAPLPPAAAAQSTGDSAAAPVAADNVSLPAAAPVFDRLDDRGVHHFSNIEPVH